MASPRSLLLLAVALVALAGCGGDDEERAAPARTGTETETAPTTEATGPVTERVTIRGTDFELSPARPRIAEPGVVEFVFRNQGETVHALEVEGPEGEVETPTFGPGGSRRLRVDLSEPGTYTMYCPVGNHRELGMEGEIVVAGGASGGTGTEKEDESGDESGGGAGY
jgi:plastocyanin